MESNWLNLMNLLKKILIWTEIAYHLKIKKMFNELVQKRSSEFWKSEKNSLDNLTYE